MANHVRRQLREAVGTAVTGLTTTASRVHQSRVYPLQTTELPALRIFTADEEADQDTVHPNAIVERQVRIVVQGVAEATSDLDDTLDLIAKEVETALAAGVTISSKVINLVYRGCTIELSGDGEKPTGQIALLYDAHIFNLANTPDVFA